MPLVGGLDFGGGAVKACVVDSRSLEILSLAQRPVTTDRPDAFRAEFDPDDWWAAACAAMRDAVGQAGRPLDEYGTVVVASLRQGYVLVGGGRELGPGVLNSDRRGADRLEQLRDEIGIDELYATTGHWPAPELTLPKLLHDRDSNSDRWACVEWVLFVHDWALWRLTGVAVSEPSIASGGQLLDIARRAWAHEIFARVQLDGSLFPPLVDSGTRVGTLRDAGLGLPLGLAVVAGGGDTQVAAAGAGGLARDTVSIVAGTTTPVQAALPDVPEDPERHPWVSAHLVPDLWAAETNAGYAGMNLDWLARLTGRSVAELAAAAQVSEPGARGLTALVATEIWSERTWAHRQPNALLGFSPAHELGDVARAFIEAHAYAIRANLADLERASGRPFQDVLLLGGAGRDPAFAQLVADVTGRPLHVPRSAYPAGRTFGWLAARAEGHDRRPPGFEGDVVEPRTGVDYEAAYARFCAADDGVPPSFVGGRPA